MSPTTADPIPGVTDVAAHVDEVLEAFLSERRDDAMAIAPDAAGPVDEIVRIVRAGGKRVRPAFCYWGYRAAGGEDAPAIWRAAAALELLHTMALIHDDVLDRSAERRGVPTTHEREASAAIARGQADPRWVGLGVAVVTGDLAAAFAEHLFWASGFEPGRLRDATERFHAMRASLAAGAYLDLVGADLPHDQIAHLKGGAYTVEYPLLIGAALAGSSREVDAALVAYAAPLGRAFQLLDDFADGEAVPGATREDALRFVGAAADAVASPPLTSAAAAALTQLAALVGTL
jgi:geranylgeranyl diphosphate synthase type I